MKIIRNNIEIELTEVERERIYREVLMEYHCQDVESQWHEIYGEDADYPYSEQETEYIAIRANQIMNKNDSYWDSYWYCYEKAIKEKEFENSK